MVPIGLVLPCYVHLHPYAEEVPWMMIFWMPWILLRDAYAVCKLKPWRLLKILRIFKVWLEAEREADSQVALKENVRHKGHDRPGLRLLKNPRLRLVLGGADGSEMEACWTFRVRTSDLAPRSYDIGYLCDLDTVGDLHFEYARVSRRGANGFCLIQDGIRLKGTWKLERIDDKTIIMAPTHDGESLGSPISCKRRGGSPSSIRSKIARKLSKATNPRPACTELIQALWVVEADALRSAGGTADQTKAVVHSLMQKRAAEYREGSWILKQNLLGSSSRDPWAQGNDPWAKAAVVGPQRVVIKEPSEKVVAFESFVLKSQFVRESGQPMDSNMQEGLCVGQGRSHPLRRSLCQSAIGIPWPGYAGGDSHQ